jgi:hypothetical protein
MSKTLINFYQTTWRNIPKDGNIRVSCKAKMSQKKQYLLGSYQPVESAGHCLFYDECDNYTSIQAALD